MQTLELSLFADYFQFYIQDDDDGFGDLSEAWSPEAEANLMALGDHVVGIGTGSIDARYSAIQAGSLLPVAPTTSRTPNESKLLRGSMM